MSAPFTGRGDKENTVYVGNLDERATDALVWELMLQAGRIVNVHLPKDRVTQTHQGYGFVEYGSQEDADYAAKIMNQVRLFGKPMRVNMSSQDRQRTVEVGAELFVGNLDSMVDERVLLETFQRFGTLISPPKLARDEKNLSKGYGFISYADFEASDAAVGNMHGQYLMNKEMTVQYAYKKDGKGERHGDEAERMLAAQARKHNVQPNIQPISTQMFQTPQSAAPQQTPMMTPNGPPPPGFGMPNGQYQPPPHQQHAPPPRAPSTPLAPPPSGLPARPPPSQAGYGGPPQIGMPPMGAPPPGFGPPQGFNGPPPGFGPPPGMPGPPGFAPPGFGPPAGFPPPPQQYQQQQQQYGRR